MARAIEHPRGDIPRVSIGMPVYNGAQFLEQAIESILGQTYTDFELVISDNASEDETGAIARSFTARDPRVFYHRHDRNAGAAWNYNFVFRHARGGFFKWAAHDDVIAPEFLERCVAALDDRPSAVIAFASTNIIDEEGRVLSSPTAPARRRDSPADRLRELLLTDEPYVRHCLAVSGLIRSAALRDTRLVGRHPSADRTLLVELAMLGEFVNVPEFLFSRRFHALTSRRANTTPEEVADWFDTTRRHGFPMPRTRLAQSFAAGVFHSPIPWRAKLACFGVVARWLARDRAYRVIVGEQRIRIRELLAARRHHTEQ